MHLVIVKLWPGRTEDQKKQMTGEIVKAIKNIIDVVESSISVAIHEVPEKSGLKKFTNLI